MVIQIVVKEQKPELKQKKWKKKKKTINTAEMSEVFELSNVSAYSDEHGGEGKRTAAGLNRNIVFAIAPAPARVMTFVIEWEKERSRLN